MGLRKGTGKMYRKEMGKIFRAIVTCVVAAVVAAGGGTPLLANETGTVRGTVTLEENGDFIRGAVIVVVGSGASALTDKRGRFKVDDVPAGEYEVLAQREHLSAGRQTVIVEPGGTATANFVLGLSPLQEEVTVTASPGGTETALEAFNAVSDGPCVRCHPGVGRRSCRCARARTGHRGPQLRARSEPADHPRVRR